MSSVPSRGSVLILIADVDVPTSPIQTALERASHGSRGGGQAIYALCKTVVEPVFGQIKGARGLDRFRLRGLEEVNGKWALMPTTHNLLKLFRASLATG
nr:transposase [Cyanobium gracile]